MAISIYITSESREVRSTRSRAYTSPLIYVRRADMRDARRSEVNIAVFRACTLNALYFCTNIIRAKRILLVDTRGR